MAGADDSSWMIGPGLALDPEKYFIVSTELFGNGHSSSPSNAAAPLDGPRFPVVTIRDNVEIVYRLLTEGLDITHLRAVVGFSMGAMQAFQWGVSHPDFVERIIPICGNAKSYDHGNVRLEGLITALTLDPVFAGGDYATQPEAGLSAFGMVWAPWLYSQEWWRNELWLEADPESSYASVVEEFRTDFLPGADANDVILQCRTWQKHDVGTTPGFDGDTSAALRSITAEVLYLPSETDLYFPVGDARFEAIDIPNVTLLPIPSLWGHPAGSGPNPVDAEFVHRSVSRFLAGEPVGDADVDDSLAGQYLETLAILLGGVARVTVPHLDTATLSAIERMFESALAAIAEHSIPGLHEHGWNIVFAIVDNCPDGVLVDATRGGIASVVDRFTRTTIAGVADWELLTERYTELSRAILARDSRRTVSAIDTLYQLPSADAV
jgi:homoserine O-acetyltransferase